MSYNPTPPLGQTTSSASLPVTIASDQTSVKTRLSAPQADVTGSITTAATSITATDLIGVGSATVQISGTYAGVSVIFEASMDNTNWTAIKAQVVGGATSPSTTAVLATNSINQFNISPLLGQYQFRVRSTAYTSGTAAVQISLSAQFVSYTTEAMQAGTWTNTVTQATGTNLHTVIDSEVPGVGATNLGKAEDAAHASGDTGVFALAVRNDNLATTYGQDQDYSPMAVDLNGRTLVAQKTATATLSNVSGSATSVTVLAANASRIGATITNDSSALLYVKFGTTASTTSYTVVLTGAAAAPFSYYEVPAGYTGIITGIWATATGTARVTEMT